jgi:hypothetical protein
VKLANLIQESGEYSIEAWAAPANVTQTNAWLVSYSGSNTTRNVTLGQAAEQYEGFTRSSVTDTNGMPPLVTTTTNGAAQAALQHVVLTYDPVNGQKLWVNGVFTGDMDPSKGGSLANWDSTFALVLGNETSGQRQWQGVIKMVAVYNTALTQAQIQQNFAAGVGQRYFLLFGVSALTGVSQSYVMFTASQYDNYSYLFAQPKFISLNPSATVPGNLNMAGMRIGVNGRLAPSGQSFATLSASIGGANYTAANGQLLSPLGTVIPVALGAANDLFFLSFDQLGSHSHSFVDPPGTPTPPTPNNTPVPDFGVTTFERINNALSRITGVPITDPVVQPLFMSAQQSMPATPLMSAFISSQQTAISTLANAYCGELMANAAYRDAFFTSGLDASLGGSSTAFFGATGSANRAIVIDALANNAVGSTVSPQMAAAVKSEVDALITRVPQINAAATVTQTTVAACTAALASAAVTLQ